MKRLIIYILTAFLISCTTTNNIENFKPSGKEQMRVTIDTSAFAIRLKSPNKEILSQITKDCSELRKYEGNRYLGKLKGDRSAEKYTDNLRAKYPNAFHYAADLPKIKMLDKEEIEALELLEYVEKIIQEEKKKNHG